MSSLPSGLGMTGPRLGIYFLRTFVRIHAFLRLCAGCQSVLTAHPLLHPDLTHIMPSRRPDYKPDRLFYDSITDKSLVSRFRVYVESSTVSRQSRSTASPHWTFKANHRRPSHNHVRLDPSTKARHANAVLEFCQRLTADQFSTRTKPDNLSFSIISKSNDFESTPTGTDPSCALWASKILEDSEIKTLQFKVVVGDIAAATAAAEDDPDLTEP
jgi:hypothetical protein